MADYTPNSKKYKEEQEEKKKVEKVVTGVAKTKPKSGVSRFMDSMIADDVSNIKAHIIMDILIPSAKKAISDIVTNGIDMLLYGEAGRSTKASTISKVSYSSFGTREKPRSGSIRTSRFDFDDIVLEKRSEAEEVIFQMECLLDEYGIVTVADLYDLVGVSSNNYMTNKYGWTNLNAVSIVRVKDGYIIKLPKAIPVD